MFESQFVIVTKKSGHQRCDNKGGLLYTFQWYIYINYYNTKIANAGYVFIKLLFTLINIFS